MDKIKILKMLIFIIILIGASYLGYKQFTKPTIVDYIKLSKSQYQDTVLASGKILSSNVRTITSEVAAKISALLVEEGKEVKKEDLILKLDSSELTKNIKEAKAGVNFDSSSYNKIVTTSYELAKKDLEKLELELSQLNIELERKTKLYESGAVPQVEIEELNNKRNLISKQIEATKINMSSFQSSGSEAKKALASIQKSKVSLDNLEESYNKYEYKAPITGTITSLSVADGEYVQPGQEIMKITDLYSKYAQIEVDEKNITKIYIGQKAYIFPSSDTEKIIETTVKEISKNVNTETGTVSVKLDIPYENSDIFLLELSITAQLVLDIYEDIYVVDASYLYYDEENNPYLLIEKNGLVDKLKVTVTGNGAKRIINGELTDETLILSPEAVKLGERVKLKSVGE